MTFPSAAVIHGPLTVAEGLPAAGDTGTANIGSL